MVQGLRLHAANAGGTGLIPGGGAKILQATQSSQKKKKRTHKQSVNIAVVMTNPSL